MSDFRITVLRASRWAGAVRFVSRSLNLLQLFVLSRILGPVDFGLVGIALLVYSFVDSMTSLGLNDALIQTKEQSDADLHTLFFVNIIRGVILFVVVLAVAYPVVSYLKEPRSLPYVLAIGLMPLLACSHNPGVVLFQKNMDFRSEFKYLITGTLISCLATIFVSLLTRSGWALIFGMMLENGIQSVMSYRMCKFRPRFVFSRESFNSMFRFGKWLLGTQFLKYFAQQAPAWAIVSMSGATSLGLYQVASKLSQALGNEFSKFVSAVAFPTFSKISGNIPKMLAVYLSSQRIILSVSGLIFGILMCMSEHVIITFLGGKWIAASPIVLIVAILAFIQSIGAQVEVSKALGLPRFIFVMSVFRTFGVLVLVVPLTKAYGPIGSALSILLPVVCLLPITMNRILQELNGSRIGYGKIIGPPIIAILGCMVAIGMIKSEVPRNAAGFFILLTVYSILYLVLIIKMDFVLNGGICGEFIKMFNSLGFFRRRSA